MAIKGMFRRCLQKNSDRYRLLPSRAEMIEISATYFMKFRVLPNLISLVKFTLVVYLSKPD